MTQPIPFGKYKELGAYHWEQCDRRSRNYNPPLEARYAVVVRAARGLGPLAAALDVGCGDGYLMAQLSGMAERVEGVDSQSDAIALARHQLAGLANCRPRPGSCYELPFPAGQFDLVTFTDVIEHLEQPGQALAEIARVLKPGGCLLLTTPKHRPDRMWDPLHVREYTPEQLHDCLRLRFSSISLRYFWPLRWSNFYATRVGWRLTKHYARYLYNPFLREAGEAKANGQILAVCR